MEQTDNIASFETATADGNASPPPASNSNGSTSLAFVYALGQIEPRFPSLAVEKELVQVTGRAGVVGLTDREALEAVLADRANRSLARQLCWVFVIEGRKPYLLPPRAPADLELLIEA